MRTEGGICFKHSTLVTGATSRGQFLVVDVNKRQAGIPIYNFSYTVPDIDLVTPSTDLVIDKGTYSPQATSYGAGIALTVNGSSYCIPLFRVDQNSEVFPQVTIFEPFIVTDMTSTGQFLIINADNQPFGVPLYRYNSIYPFTPLTTSSPAVSTVEITTEIRVGKQTLDVADTPYPAGSTYLNPKIRAYSQLITRVKQMLGYPAVDVEVCDDVIADFIDQAIEIYTKYTGFTEEYLLFNTRVYKHGCGVKLDELFTAACNPDMATTCCWSGTGAYDYDLRDYRKVAECFQFEAGEASGINTLFTLEQAMAQQTYFSYMLGNAGFDLITWEVLKGWLETRKKVLAQQPYYRFDPKTQFLKIIPEPNQVSNYYAVIGCRVERRIRDLINERWIFHYVLALTKITLGNIRGKYGNMALFGGGSLSFDGLISQGIDEKKTLENELFNTFGEVEPPLFFFA